MSKEDDKAELKVLEQLVESAEKDGGPATLNLECCPICTHNAIDKRCGHCGFDLP